MSNTYFNISDKLRLYEFDGLLDQYGDAAAAYSLRKLRSGYTGSAIRVRRSSDNTERDMGFYDNELDTIALLDFCGEDNHITYSDPAINAEANTLSNANLAVNDWGLGEPTLDNKVILDRDAGNALAYFRQEYVIPGEEYTISCFVKILDGNPPEFGTSDKQGYLTLGGTNFGQPLDYTVTNIATDIYRISATGNAGTGTFQFGFLRWTSNSLGQIEVAGMQVTKGNQITDYVPTRAGSSGFGFVHTWYDQSANANHAVQGTATAQPKIVDAGVVVTEGGETAIQIEEGLFFDSNIHGIATLDYFTVGNPDRNTYIHISETSTGSQYSWVAKQNDFSTGIFSSFGSPTLYANGIAQSISTRDDVFQATNGYKLLSTLNADTSVWISSRLFGYGSIYYYTGTIQEMVFYDNTKSSSRTDIESNINTYYSIY